MEDYTLMSDFEVHNLVDVAEKIQNELLRQKKGEEGILLQLELQAVIQVLTQRLALLLDSSSCLGSMHDIIKQINRLEV